MSIRTYPNKCNDPDISFLPSVREAEMLNDLMVTSRLHESGGSYNMISMYVKNSHREYGFNRLKRLASTVSDIYPEVFGMHAELDLYRKMGRRSGGTVFIAGTRNNGSKMVNSRPCCYCATILDLAGIRWAIYYENGVPTKAKISELV